MSEVDPLLEAVEALTKPQLVKQMRGAEVIAAELPSLLVQLDNSITASLGGNTAGGSATFEGTIVNSAALMKLIQISSQVVDWCRIRHCRTVRGDTAGNLNRWYLSTLAGEFEPIGYVRKLREWGESIRNLLDPPECRDLPDRCPAEDCGADRWWRDQTEGGLRPLVVYFRHGEPVENGSAECRACGRKWGIRELAYALEHRPEPGS